MGAITYIAQDREQAEAVLEIHAGFMRTGHEAIRVDEAAYDFSPDDGRVVVTGYRPGHEARVAIAHAKDQIVPGEGADEDRNLGRVEWVK